MTTDAETTPGGAPCGFPGCGRSEGSAFHGPCDIHRHAPRASCHAYVPPRVHNETPTPIHRGHEPNLSCHPFLDPRSVAPATPSPQVSSPTGTPERANGSGVPPAEVGLAPVHIIERLMDVATLLESGDSTPTQAADFLRATANRIPDSFRPLRERVATLESQVTDLQAANTREVERRRKAEAKLDRVADEIARFAKELHGEYARYNVQLRDELVRFETAVRKL